MYALLVNNNSMRSSFYQTLDEALEKANEYLGVTGIENLETGKLEYRRNPKTYEMEKVES